MDSFFTKLSSTPVQVMPQRNVVNDAKSLTNEVSYVATEVPEFNNYPIIISHLKIFNALI